MQNVSELMEEIVMSLVVKVIADSHHHMTDKFIVCSKLILIHSRLKDIQHDQITVSFNLSFDVAQSEHLIEGDMGSNPIIKCSFGILIFMFE